MTSKGIDFTSFAYSQGWNAYVRGAPLTSCPYSSVRGQGHSKRNWLAGWNVCKAELDRQQSENEYARQREAERKAAKHKPFTGDWPEYRSQKMFGEKGV